MLKITSSSDIENSSLAENIRKYITDYIHLILIQFQVNSLQKIGCVYFLEDNQDTQRFKEIGLEQPLKETPFEYCELITLNSSHEEIKLLHGCYVFNNDFVIDIFGQSSIFDYDTLQALLG